MNRRSKQTNIFLQIVSFIMIFVAIGLGIGTKFFDFGFNLDEEVVTVSFWILFVISTMLTLVMFFSSSSISTSKEFESNEDYHKKVKNVNEVNTVTGLEYAEDFLDEHYIDKKYEKVLKKFKNKLERVRKKADRRGYNFVEPEKQEFRGNIFTKIFRTRQRFNRIYKKYKKLKDKIEDPSLRDDVKYRYVRGVYRVVKAYLSDGVKKYNLNRDPDKPVSGVSVQAKKGSQKLAFSLIIVLFSSNIAYDIIDQGFNSAFWIDLGLKIVSYLTTIVNGYMFGKTYFGDVYLDLEIKRENLLQKYIRWLKNNHPAEWSSMLQQRKNLREKEMEMRVKTDLEREHTRRSC